MSVRARLPLAVLVWVFVLAAIALAVTDPELEQCKHQCGHQRQFTRQQTQECEHKCDIYYKEKRRREEEEKQQGSEGKRQPYVFQDQHFATTLKTQHGSFRLLPKFTKSSKILKGIESYRLAILEANPQSFVLPNHWDAECILFVANGKGTISLLGEEKRESFNLRSGDAMRIEAGTPLYIINSDEIEKFVIVILLQPVNTPGEYWPFYDAAGEEPESYYRAFSTQLLEVAFNTNRERLERILKQHKEGVFVKASQEQIEAMSQDEKGGSIWPFGGESKLVFHLFNQRPSQVNQYGNVFEVKPKDWKELQLLDVSLSFVNITQGSMAAPFYNSKSTKIAFVTKGDGYFEMACPHLASNGGQSKSSPSYLRVSSRLKSGIVYIVPPAHPVITVASENQDLQLVWFGINAHGNRKIPLAGKRNLFSRMGKEAKELSFNVKAEEVDKVFRSQDEEFFFKIPRKQQREEGWAYA